MRIERVVLEDHRDVAVLRRHVVDEPLANEDVAARLLLEPGDHAKGGGLAATGGSHEDEELFVLDLQRQVIDREDISELLCHVIERDRGHPYPPALVSGQSMSPTVGLEARERWPRAASLGRCGVGASMDRVAPRVPCSGDEATEHTDAVRDGACRRSEVDDDPTILSDADERGVLGRELP